MHRQIVGRYKQPGARDNVAGKHIVNHEKQTGEPAHRPIPLVAQPGPREDTSAKDPEKTPQQSGRCVSQPDA